MPARSVLYWDRMAVRRASHLPEDVPGAEGFLPARHTLTALRAAVQTCHGCTLYRTPHRPCSARAVRTSRVVLIGEVPGDSEDLAGKPFVGPPGRLLDEALGVAGRFRATRST